MYTVIFSTDPYLLARMATDLQMEGMKACDLFETPFKKGFKWLAIYKDRRMGFYNHRCVFNPIRHTLTARNYLKVLGEILNSKK